MTCNETLPALPGGVGALSDRLAALSGLIVECGNILAEYRRILSMARRDNIAIPQSYRKQVRKAMRPIERQHTLASLRLCIILMEQNYGRGNTCLSLH